MNVRSIAFVSAMSLVSVITPAYAADPPSAGRTEWPSEVKIKVTPGPGCPELSVTPSPDFEAVTLNTQENLLTAQRQHLICRVGIDYSFPAGWRFYRPNAVLRGFSSLDGGQTAVWVVRTKLEGADFSSVPVVTRGPFIDDFSVILGDGEEAGEAPTQCGATSAHFDVEFIGSLFAGPHPANITLSTVDSIDTEIDWERCR